jgi:hypothetical protein
MIVQSEIPNPTHFIKSASAATSTKAIRELLSVLPIVSENEYSFDEAHPERGWASGRFHWLPVGKDRGNAGRIKLAGQPENPIAERTVNGMEARIELERQRELKTHPGTPPPSSPRDAAMRYFDLPSLSSLPKWPQPIRGKKPRDYGRDVARGIRVRLVTHKPVEYAVIIEDDGIGQPPDRMHSTLLSLGRSDKPDKPYLIGVFGQGGSSAYAASEFSWIMSRRAPDLLDGATDGVGWTVVKRVVPAGRRDVYWAYLAAHPDGRVARLPVEAADAVGLKHGTRIAHIKYDFGKTEPSASLYRSLNHLLFNPILPYELYTRPAGTRGPDPMWGNGYRLSRLTEEKALDKTFAPQAVEKKGES